MADYISALGRMASERVSEAKTGFVRGVKDAFLSEVPGITGAAGFVSTLKEYAAENQAVAKEQKVNNVISLEMVRQLRMVNSNIIQQTNLAAKADRRAEALSAFQEENEREKAVRDDKLIKAIQSLQSSNDPSYKNKGGGFVQAATDSLLEKFGVSAAGAAIGTASGGALARFAPMLGRLLLNPYVLGAIAAVVGIVIATKSFKQDKGGKVGFGAGDGMNDAINYGGMTPTGGGGGDAGGGAGGAGGGGNTGAKPGTQATSTINWIVPIEGLFTVTSPYGVQRSTGTHKGIDLAPSDKSSATFAIAAADGTVTEIASRGGYGNFVIIKHADGYTSLYGHLNNYKFAKGLYKGLRVRAGTRLGIVGNTGRSRGTHLHFEILKGGSNIDPASVVPGLRGGNKNSEVPKTAGDSKDYSNAQAAASAAGGGGPTSRGAATAGAAPSASSAYLSGYTSFEDRERAAVGLVTPGGGTAVSSYMTGYISPAERLQLSYLNLIVRNTKGTENAVRSQSREVRATTSRGGSQRQAAQDPFTRYYQSRITSLGQQFEATTRRLINTTLTETLFPGKFFGVSRRQAEQPGYLGNLITKELQFQKRLTPLFNNLLGKRFGGQYASLFSQAGGLLLDKGVNALGGMLGFDANSPFGFGQIVGNLMTKGKQGKEARRLGMEQLIYSMTGIPLGAQSGLTFLQKTFPSLFGGATGYMTPQQQMMGLTNSAMGFLQPGMMFGQTLAGGMNMIPGPAAQMQMAMLNRATMYNGYRMTQDTANQVAAQQAMYGDTVNEQTKTQGGFFDSLGETFTNGFKSLMSVFGFSGGMGGGSPLGMGGGPSGGGFLDNLMYAGGNLATMYIGAKLFGKTPFGKSKNPLVQIVGSMAMNYLVKSGFQIAANALGFGDIAGKFLGANTGLADLGGAFLGTLTGASTSGITAATLGELGINTALPVGSVGGPASVVSGVTTAAPITAAGGGAISSAAAAASSVGDAAALGIDSAVSSAGSSVLGDLAASAGEILPYAVAIIKLFQGDIVGAAGSAAGAFIGNLILPGIGGVIGSFLGSFLGGGKADPRVTWAIYVNGNSDPTAGGVIDYGKKTPDEMYTGAKRIGVMLFAMVKRVQLTLGGGPLAYDYFVLELHGKAKTAYLFVGNGTVKTHGDKTIWTAPIEDISKKEVFNSMADALLTAMTEQTAADKAKTAKASVSKLTKPELETGNVIGAGEEVKIVTGQSFANKFQAKFSEAGYDSSETYIPRQVYNAALNAVVPEENALIFGYNKEGQAVDLQGNVVDFSKYATAAGFTGSTAVKEAYKEDYIGSGEDAGGTNYYARKVFNARTGKYQEEENLNVVGYDREGKAVKYDDSGFRPDRVDTAVAVTNGTILSLQQQQATNDALKNSNPTTAAQQNGGTAVVNSGNRIDNSTQTTVINTSLRDEGFMFGAFRQSEFDRFVVIP